MKIKIQSGPTKILSDVYTNAEVLGMLNTGEHAELLKTFYKFGDKWDKIKTEKGVKGYLLNADFFKILDAHVTQSEVPVYEKPSENSTVVTILEKTERFKILDKTESKGAEWLFIEDDFGDKGYILKSVSYGVFKNRIDRYFGETTTSKNISGFYGLILGIILVDLLNSKFHFNEKYSGTIYIWFMVIPLIISNLFCTLLFTIHFRLKGNRKFADKSWQMIKRILFMRVLPALTIATMIDLLFNLEKYFSKQMYDFVCLAMGMIFYILIDYLNKKRALKV